MGLLVSLIADPPDPLLRGDDIARLTGAGGARIGALVSALAEEQAAGAVEPKNRRWSLSAGSRFDRTADQYAAAARKRDWDDLVAWREPQPEDRVLDVAGGTGALAEVLLPRVGSITVSDVSEAMLAHVGSGITTLVARAEQLPILDDSIDLVVRVHAPHYIDRPVRAIDEMRRVVVPRRPAGTGGFYCRRKPWQCASVGGGRAAA